MNDINENASSSTELSIVNEIMTDMDTWREECLVDQNIRVNNSIQVQLYNLIRLIHKACPAMPPLTYDVRLDPNFDNENADAEFSDDTSIWYALGFYLKRLDGERKDRCHRDATLMEKTIRTGIYNLKTQTLGTKPPLYVTAHSTGNRDVEIITFNPDHLTAKGKTVAEISGEKVDKRWNSALASKIAKDHNLSLDEARVKAKQIAPMLSGSISALPTQQLEG